ncbi:MAG: VOC family protein [Candidatus Thermoplasmatota archaeon]
MSRDKMFKDIDHVEIVVSPDEFDRHIDFFTEVLRFKIKSSQKDTPPDSPIEEIVYLELNESVVELMSVEDPEEMTSAPFQVGYRVIAIEVSDMEEAECYLEGKGIEIVWGPKDLDGSMRAEIRTPNGLPIELREWE